MSIRKSTSVKLAVLLLGAAGILAGCAAAVPHPDVADERRAAGRWPGTTIDDLERGRSLFVDRCAGCHDLPRPDQKSADEWPGLVADMADGARLSRADRDLVARYLSTESDRMRTARP